MGSGTGSSRVSVQGIVLVLVPALVQGQILGPRSHNEPLITSTPVGRSVTSRCERRLSDCLVGFMFVSRSTGRPRYSRDSQGAKAPHRPVKQFRCRSVEKDFAGVYVRK